jgi:3-phenylpropionate/trans-cinnamate dioxygenase ferredoxin component
MGGDIESNLFTKALHSGWCANEDPVRVSICDTIPKFICANTVGCHILIPCFVIAAGKDGLASCRHTSIKLKGKLMQNNSLQMDAVNSSDQPEAFEVNQFRVHKVSPGSTLLVGDVAVFNVADHFCATQARCTHKQGPLSEGRLDGSTVTCPWHGSKFDVCTGAVLQGPATDQLKTYQVVVADEIGRVAEMPGGAYPSGASLPSRHPELSAEHESPGRRTESPARSPISLRNEAEEFWALELRDGTMAAQSYQVGRDSHL